MANFIALVYATLKNEGVDTSKMSQEEAIKKFKELQKQSGVSSGEKEATPAESRKVKEISKNNSKIKTEENDENIRRINKPIDERNKQLAETYKNDEGMLERFKERIKNDPEFVKKIKELLK